MATTSDSDIWAHALATLLKEDFPHIADAVSAGLGSDPTALIKIVRDDRSVASGFQAMCTTVEAFIAHILNTTAAEKGDLHAQVRALNADIQEKTDTLRSLAKSVEQLSVSGQIVSTPNITARRISKDPESFSGGEKDVAKRQQQFVVWRSQLQSCFAQDTAVFNTERRKILHIAGLLTDDVYELHRTYFDTITQNATTPDTWHWKTADDVFKTLSTQFETMDLAQQASQKFDNLYMLNKPFQNFIAEFRTLAQRCDKTEQQKVEALKKKVSKELADKLAYQPLPPAKDDFEGWCNLCQQLYNNEQEFKHFEHLKSGRPTPPQQRYQRQLLPAPDQSLGVVSPPSPPDTGEPMQLDSARAAARAAARAFCGENNLCYYCRKPGHIVADCTEKKAADARFANRNSFSDTRGRGAFRGRGSYRSPLHTYPRNPYESHPHRLRILDQVHTDDETVSTMSSSQVTEQPQGKD